MSNKKLLRFNDKNLDVYKILMEKSNDPKTNASQYVCEAVRFYEKYKDYIRNNLKIQNYDNSLNLKDEFSKINDRLNQIEKAINNKLESVNHESNKEDNITTIDDDLRNLVLSEED